MTAPLDPPVLEEAAPGSWLTPRTVFTALLLAVLAFVPIYALLTSDTFAMTLFTRVLILALGAVSCQGPQPFYRGSNLVSCSVQRQECELMDNLTGLCRVVNTQRTESFEPQIRVDKSTTIDQNTICKTTFCTNDVNAPGTCSATFINVFAAPDGVCEAAPAGTAPPGASSRGMPLGPVAEPVPSITRAGCGTRIPASSRTTAPGSAVAAPSSRSS